ncbi:DinB family protein [Pseudonocardia lacus]|uniref:DinB family protein n=1 Tax=Pseudonocardia lacus TaxID=2835865 RepID=UPI001BDD1961|nr:DinB family protein [Pseudonocardia lacus]
MKDERAAVLHFLAAQRRSALAVLDGLSETDAGRSVVPSGWTPLSMAEHLGGVERHWFGYALGGGATWTRAVPGEPRTLDEAVRAYRAEIERSDRLLAGFALDDPITAVPDELPGEIHTVRDVLLHVIEEVARHCGHLDIARELLDGRTGLGPR